MVTFLLAALVLLDIGLLMAILALRKRQIVQIGMIEDLTEERRILTDLRNSIQDELEVAGIKTRETLEKVTHIATEAEQEVKMGSETLAKEMEKVVSQLSERFDGPLMDLSKKQTAIEMLIKRIEQEKVLLHKLVTRGEKICKFFDKRVPYEEVLQEIEDKKYTDARHLLTKGMSPETVAHELGLSESEVRLVAGLAVR